jgi:hypothetical protein
MNRAEAQTYCASGPSSGIPAGLSDEERARYSKLSRYLKARLNYKKKPPHIVVITDLARDYDDLTAMMMMKSFIVSDL